jgi:peptidoglycan hydrolase CwlO-like protein
MSRIAMPRWSVYAMVLALVASMAFSVGALTSVGANSHDTSFHACLYAGSLSQVSNTPPTNCGRGTVVSWPSAADFAELQAALEQEILDRIAGDEALQAALDAEIAARIAADADLQNQVNALALALQAETDARVAADTNLQNQIDTLNGLVATLQGQVTTLQGQVASLQADMDVLQPIVFALQVTVAAIQSAIDGINAFLDVLADAICTVSLGTVCP